ncbi:MAG: hypothetical protein M1376_01700 [Planctomycetes bacterium]|nr:hypothetical protein [Planctomycetota bacterium]
MFEGKGEYQPPGQLIRVISPRTTIIWGAVIIVVGIIFVVVALTEDLEARRRRHQNVRLIRAIGVATGAVTMAAGAGILAVGCRRCRRLRHEGRVAQAEVIGRWQRRPWTRFHQHYIAYGFVALLPDGTTSVVGCRMADATLHYQLRVGDQFAVRYLPSNLHIGAPVTGSWQVRRR